MIRRNSIQFVFFTCVCTVMFGVLGIVIVSIICKGKLNISIQVYCLYYCYRKSLFHNLLYWYSCDDDNSYFLYCLEEKDECQKNKCTWEKDECQKNERTCRWQHVC